MIAPPVGLYVLLMHGPVLGPEGNTISTAVTPLDVTDIARSCRTFGVQGYGIIQPDPNQQALARRIRNYWMQRVEGPRAHRTSALERVEVFATMADAYARWGDGYTVVTSASAGAGTVDFGSLQTMMAYQRLYVVFGTGYGLMPETMQAASAVAPAIQGAGDFAHLSVRAAVAIVLDRIVNAPHQAPLD